MDTRRLILIDTVRKYYPQGDLAPIEQAYDFAVEKHGDQKRASGEPYYTHPVEVAQILADMKLDPSTIVTAILHDTVEDTVVTLDEIEEKFGKEIRSLVDGVTKLGKIEAQPENIRQAENFRKLLLAISDDLRVLLVKLADRLHNMRTIHHINSHDKRTRIAHETLEIYAPLAERIGMHSLKGQLQDIAFRELHSDAYQSIVGRLNFLRESGKDIVTRISEHIHEILIKEGISSLVTGREKAPYSIWKKMEQKNVSFEQLSDIMAFRIIVKGISECYQALGTIHSNFPMIPESFKDYISTPKDNGYRSLHTVVIGPEKQRIEIQIRTEEMHDIAEMGVAAHWAYKQNQDYTLDGRQFRWIRELLQILDQASGPEDFLENTKLEMYHDQVFCFSPKGKLIALPKGATPVDFAYAVHSDVGHTCVGAKVNGRIVPLRTILQNGDQVEIIRSKSQTPSPAWEKFVVSGKARSEIRRFIRTRQREEYINLGRAILEKAFEQESQEFKDEMLKPLLPILQKKTVEDIFASVGEGLLSKGDVIKTLFPTISGESGINGIKKTLSLFTRLRTKKLKEKDGVEIDRSAIPIKGLIPGMAVHFAGCCHPLPGDKIVGIVNTGKGVTIHTHDCDMLENYSSSPERFINVSWDEAGHEASYVGRIKAVLSHEAGSLGTLANTIAKDMGNINNLKIINRSPDFFEIIVDIEVRDIRHLSSVMASLRSKPVIYSVERYN